MELKSCFQWKIFVWKNANKLKNRYQGTYFPRSSNQTSYEAEETKRGKKSMREAVKIEGREEKDRWRRGWWGERSSKQNNATDLPPGASQCVEHVTLWIRQRTTSPRETEEGPPPPTTKIQWETRKERMKWGSFEREQQVKGRKKDRVKQELTDFQQPHTKTRLETNTPAVMLCDPLKSAWSQKGAVCCLRPSTMFHIFLICPSSLTSDPWPSARSGQGSLAPFVKLWNKSVS